MCTTTGGPIVGCEKSNACQTDTGAKKKMMTIRLAVPTVNKRRLLLVPNEDVMDYQNAGGGI